MSRGSGWLFIFCWLLMVPWVSAQEALRDPTRPLEFQAQRAPSALTLNAILIGEGRRLAVINGNQLAEDAVIPGSGGVRLRRIQSQSVLLEQRDRRWRLALPAAAKPIRTSSADNN